MIDISNITYELWSAFVLGVMLCIAIFFLIIDGISMLLSPKKKEKPKVISRGRHYVSDESFFEGKYERPQAQPKKKENKIYIQRPK